MNKILKGEVYKGLFDGGLRYFFYPDKECEHDFIARSYDKLHLLIFIILYSGIKRGYENISFTFPDTLDVVYPVIVEGCEVRAVHSLTFYEQREINDMLELWYEETNAYFQVKKLQQNLYR